MLCKAYCRSVSVALLWYDMVFIHYGIFCCYAVLYLSFSLSFVEAFACHLDANGFWLRRRHKSSTIRSIFAIVLKITLPTSVEQMTTCADTQASQTRSHDIYIYHTHFVIILYMLLYGVSYRKRYEHRIHTHTPRAHHIILWRERKKYGKQCVCALHGHPANVLHNAHTYTNEHVCEHTLRTIAWMKMFAYVWRYDINTYTEAQIYIYTC